MEFKAPNEGESCYEVLLYGFQVLVAISFPAKTSSYSSFSFSLVRYGTCNVNKRQAGRQATLDAVLFMASRIIYTSPQRPKISDCRFSKFGYLLVMALCLALSCCYVDKPLFPGVAEIVHPRVLVLVLHLVCKIQNPPPDMHHVAQPRLGRRILVLRTPVDNAIC